MKKSPVILTVLFLSGFLGGTATAGEWHAGTNNLCSDCHTMHFSQSHNWDGSTPVSSTAARPNGNWLGASGPNNYLLKAAGNALCIACHDGQTFAPDVLGSNTNAGNQTQGRSAGGLNVPGTSVAPYEAWKGHTLDGPMRAPGGGAQFRLVCINCHDHHGQTAIYRNLGIYSNPTYVIGPTNDTSKDVWINIPAGYTPNSGNATTFIPYYDTANVSYNRNDITGGKSSNKMDEVCAGCHQNFHGPPGDSNIGASTGALFGFLRHPTAKTTIGASGAQGYDGHSSLSRFIAGPTKIKVNASDRAAWTDASPGCLTCHKAHGNQNPFALIFLNRNAMLVTEEGGYASGQTQNVAQGYRNLCGQCHDQGN